MEIPKGQLFLVKGKNLAAFSFNDMTEFSHLLTWASKNGWEPYLEAKANINADVVVGAMIDKTHTPPMDVQNTIAPNCPIHGKAMTASKYGGYYCPRKIGQNYCPVQVDEHGKWKGVPS